MCALPVEATAVTALFDEQWDHGALDKANTDTNQYSVGSIGECSVVLAHMPSMGKAAAATVAVHLRSSFRYLKLVLLVGICGGAPKPPGKASDELFLGDVVVSTCVVQYDLGWRFPDRFVRKDTPQDNLSKLSVEANSVLARLRTDQARRTSVRACSDILLPSRSGLAPKRLILAGARTGSSSPTISTSIARLPSALSVL
jgi:nucleoside phosphorylase